MHNILNTPWGDPRLRNCRETPFGTTRGVWCRGHLPPKAGGTSQGEGSASYWTLVPICRWHGGADDPTTQRGAPAAAAADVAVGIAGPDRVSRQFLSGLQDGEVCARRP